MSVPFGPSPAAREAGWEVEENGEADKSGVRTLGAMTGSLEFDPFLLPTRGLLSNHVGYWQKPSMLG